MTDKGLQTIPAAAPKPRTRLLALRDALRIDGGRRS